MIFWLKSWLLVEVFEVDDEIDKGVAEGKDDPKIFLLKPWLLANEADDEVDNMEIKENSL